MADKLSFCVANLDSFFLATTSIFPPQHKMLTYVGINWGTDHCFSDQETHSEEKNHTSECFSFNNGLADREQIPLLK